MTNTVNGYDVLFETLFPKRGWNAEASIVLCDRGENTYQRYVTWWLNRQSNGACHGHYFEDFDQALGDYRERVNQEIQNHHERFN